MEQRPEVPSPLPMSPAWIVDLWAIFVFVLKQPGFGVVYYGGIKIET
jgi:hypothetical protein